jgi:peptidyl-prolyl cis-trans isomerase SurA
MQLQLAQSDGITVDKSDVDAAVARIAKGNNTSITGFFARLQQGGIAKEQYLKQIKQQLIISKLQSQVVDGKVSVSDAAARAFIANHTKQNFVYKISDILLPLPENADGKITKELQTKAVQLRNSLVNSSMASAPKLIAQSGATASVLDYRPLNALPNLFIPAVTKLSQGKYSQVIQADNGFHILKLLAKKQITSAASSSGAITLDQAKQYLGQQQAQQLINAWLQKLRNTAYVKFYN